MHWHVHTAIDGSATRMKGYVSLTGKAVPVEEERRVSPGRDGAKIGDVLAYDCDGAQLFHRKPEYEYRPGIDPEGEQFDACPYPGRPGVWSVDTEARDKWT